jgi:hypothetical protein
VWAQAQVVFEQYPGFLVGSSNARVSKIKAARLDAVVDLDECQIDTQRFSSGPTAASASEQLDLAR